jgi:hypothetical protein
MTRAGLPHSETPGSTLPCQLPRAYRRLERPSSALDAKASTMCPYQLAKQTHNTTNNTPQKTCHRRVMALNQQSIRDTTFKRTIITLQTTHTKGACRMLASTIQESRNKSPTSPRPDHSPNRRLMPQTPNSMPCTPAETGERYECACLRPLVNTPNRHGTVVRAHEVCSLERR